MKKKSLLIAALAAAVVVASPVAANVANAEEAESTGVWKQDSKGWWYEFNDGTYAKDGIYSSQDSDAKYMFDESGYMTTGWYWKTDKTYGGGDYYYSNNSGELQSGWQKINGAWYYLHENYYYMYGEGKHTVDDTKYWFTPSGAMVDGWYNYDPASTYGNWVYCNADGSAYDGWLSYNGAWYYMEEGDTYQNTTVAKFQKADGSTYYAKYAKTSDDTKLETYYFGRDGKMIDGWYYTEYENKATGYKSNGWKYGEAGVVKKGWVKSGGKWYFTSAEGDMYRDSINFVGDSKDAPTYPSSSDYRGADGYIDWDAYEAAVAQYRKDYEEFYRKNTYVFDANGVMVTGWYASKDTYGTTWYYTNEDGTAYEGWVKSGNNYYYIDRGVMLTNTLTPDGYYVDVNGVWR